MTVYGSNLLRMVLDDVPLWRGNHVPVKQLCDDFAQYLYLPRLKNQQVLLQSVEQGISMLTWVDDGFAYAQDFNADRNRCVGLCAGQLTKATADHTSLVVKAEIAAAQIRAVADAAGTPPPVPLPDTGTTVLPASDTASSGGGSAPPAVPAKPDRFYGSVELDATRLGRVAGRVAEEVISHLAGLQGAKAEITLEIETNVPEGVPENVVRTVTENCRTLKFKNQGFENT